MGSFYVNFTTRGPEQAAIANSLQSAKRKAFVGPTVDGLTVFYDQKSDTQDEREIKIVGKQISKEHNAPVFAILNHDDDILAYWLFEPGKLVDEYNSFPGYFTDGNDNPSGGDANKICAAFEVPTKFSDVEKVLRSKEYAFAQWRHEALAALLNHPWAYVCMGYRHIVEGSLAQGVTVKDLVRIG